VTVNQNNSTVTIWDNGGIPVVKHSEYDEWVPELIFSNLKAGSNFDDSEERLVAGTNGVGSTLTNIFSTRFEVRTCDGKNEFEQTFTNNMRDRTKAEVRKIPGDGYTEISFQPDLARFGMETIDDSHVEMMRKRCIDIAACNGKLKVYFNAVEKSFTSFKDYCVKFQINYVDTVKKLETEGRIIEKKPIRLSKGTAISGEPIHCLWFKIDDEFVDTTQYGETEKVDAD
jgi:DNA topoisomerase-2